MTESGHLRVFSEFGIGGLPVLLTLALGVGGSISGAGSDNGAAKRLDDVTQLPADPALATVEVTALPDIAFSSAASAAEPRLDLKLESPGPAAAIDATSTHASEATPPPRAIDAMPDVNPQTAALETAFDLWTSAERAEAATESREVLKSASAVQEAAGAGIAAVALAAIAEPVEIAVTTPEAPLDIELAANGAESKVAVAAVAAVALQGAVELKNETPNQPSKSDNALTLASAGTPLALASIAQEPVAQTPIAVPQPVPKLAVADWDYFLPAQASDTYRQGFVASQASPPLRFAERPASTVAGTRQPSGNNALAQAANSNRSVRQASRLAPQRGGRNQAGAGSVSHAQGSAKYRLIGTEIEFQLPVMANGVPVGNLTLHVAPNQKLSLRLKELVNLFQDRIDPQLLSSMVDSPNIEAFVSFDRLREAGIDIRYDAARDRLDLSAG